ncbi:hypothetical protein EJ06DRAFT_127117 [Trichodelitschia bisporula]|uniref:Uncharacterized protein n=1 Tax=Trichodelitschia bisporula TaxID=703511 RepID=A0A6G1HQJ8_9PEZI|nr:hypothetical protein EJ06DRAFT_127117 [Trichodelitschia bisporula]
MQMQHQFFCFPSSHHRGQPFLHPILSTQNLYTPSIPAHSPPRVVHRTQRRTRKPATPSPTVAHRATSRRSVFAPRPRPPSTVTSRPSTSTVQIALKPVHPISPSAPYTCGLPPSPSEACTFILRLCLFPLSSPKKPPRFGTLSPTPAAANRDAARRVRAWALGRQVGKAGDWCGGARGLGVDAESAFPGRQSACPPRAPQCQ